MDTIVNYVEERVPTLIDFGLKVVFAIVVFFIGRALIRWIVRLVARSMEHAKVDTGVEQFVHSLLQICLYAVLVIILAVIFGIDTTSVAALITSCGLAVGLALQGSLSNFAGGVLILVLKPFKVGDYIRDDTTGNEGFVTEIQLFYTKLSTLDSRCVVIPNGNLSNNSLTNYTALEERQLDLRINISYGSDLKKAKAILENVLRSDEGILQDKPISVFVYDLGESSVIMGVRGWTKGDEYLSVKWRVQENIKLALDENGIVIPFQQVSVHMADK